MKFFKSVAFAACLVVGPQVGLAQESTNRVFQDTAWSVFVEENPTQCWVVSSPTETVNTKDGRVVAVTRGDILMFVSYWPSAGKVGEVSFMSGYPFKEDSTVQVQIGDTTFEMFTTGETAWALTPEDDAQMIVAMKRGAQAVITGLSSKDTLTKDTFSLLGFTASLTDAEKRCQQ